MDISEKTFKAMLNDGMKSVSVSNRKTLKIMVGLVIALAGGGGGFAYHAQGKLESAQVADGRQEIRLTRQEEELRATSARVESIAILLVQQGRHFESMVRAVAPPGAVLPDRPASLDAIEREILRRDGRQ
jgi:hypothetical protein